ncbi:hypothetical protein FE257_000292 [Aspergillus nanangensis]|uniref:Uncharacterized protein n=1 Tax=Aspergillus nanangensis TaxID=2582783 RepID=A0AAD4CZI1_ASPNN|nr:hypothetical protein FE257_000292 [Aspergillus nanangensis]
MHSHENMRADCLAESIGDYQHIHAKSTTSLDTTSSVSATMTSPSSTFVSESPFTPTSQSLNSSTDGNSNRPRSQTFAVSIVDPNIMGSEDCADQGPSQALLQQPFHGSIQESPREDNHYSAFFPSLDTSSNMIKRNRSNPEIKPKPMYPPLFSKSATVSPVSSPTSPTQDEALKAMELVMSYFRHQPSGLDTDDYVTMGKLLERLALAKAQHTMLPGGLTRIDEHEDMPHLTKKRSIHGMV